MRDDDDEVMVRKRAQDCERFVWMLDFVLVFYFLSRRIPARQYRAAKRMICSLDMTALLLSGDTDKSITVL